MERRSRNRRTFVTVLGRTTKHDANDIAQFRVELFGTLTREARRHDLHDIVTILRSAAQHHE